MHAPCSPRPSCASCRGCGTGAWCRRCTAPLGGRCLRKRITTTPLVSRCAERGTARLRWRGVGRAPSMRSTCAYSARRRRRRGGTRQRQRKRKEAAAARVHRRRRRRCSYARGVASRVWQHAASPRGGCSGASARRGARPVHSRGLALAQALGGGARTLAVLLEHQLALLVVLVLAAAPVLTALACGARRGSRPSACELSPRRPPPRRACARQNNAPTHPCSSACRAGLPEQPRRAALWKESVAERAAIVVRALPAAGALFGRAAARGTRP